MRVRLIQLTQKPKINSQLLEKHIVLGVCGSIAAYKAVELCRLLVDLGAHVSPVLTEEALHFVGAATFSALASESAHISPAQVALFDAIDPIPHTHLANDADLILIAPATANLIGRLANGIVDDLLTNVLLASTAKVVICPAMHSQMWEHPAVRENIKMLISRGVYVVEPEFGRLAGGDVGIGRLAGPERILEVLNTVIEAGAVNHKSNPKSGETMRDLEGVSVLVTAGGTREPIDPVRFISNRSSGKQGHALAEEALSRGGKVCLVTTSNLPVSFGIKAIHVETAKEMQEEVFSHADESDIVIMAAAVADFSPKNPSQDKISRSEFSESNTPLILELQPTVDILKTLVDRREAAKSAQADKVAEVVNIANHKPKVIVGFALQTSDALNQAIKKIQKKGVDIMVVNDLTTPGAGFDYDTNEVTILKSDGSSFHVPLCDKRQIAKAVFDSIAPKSLFAEK